MAPAVGGGDFGSGLSGLALKFSLTGSASMCAAATSPIAPTRVHADPLMLARS